MLLFNAENICFIFIFYRPYAHSPKKEKSWHRMVLLAVLQCHLGKSRLGSQSFRDFFKRLGAIETSVQKLNWHYIKLQLFESFFSLVRAVGFLYFQSYSSSGLDHFLRSVLPNRNQSISNAFPFCCLVQAVN